jgi:hypothetical protein
MSTLDILLTAISLFAGILVCMELGRQIGRSQTRKHSDRPVASFPAVEGSVFGLMGLLIAFTFSSAAARFEARRQLLVQETVTIGTAWRRIDLLPESRQDALRDCFRQYVDAHLAFTRKLTDPDAARNALQHARALQREIWTQAVSASREASTPAATTLLLTPLNAMSEMMTARLAAAETHLPLLIRALLIILPLICALMAGLSSAQRPERSWLHMLGFAAVLAITIYVILDLEHPRAGLIRLDTFDQAIVELRNSMQ